MTKHKPIFRSKKFIESLLESELEQNIFYSAYHDGMFNILFPLAHLQELQWQIEVTLFFLFPTPAFN